MAEKKKIGIIGAMAMETKPWRLHWSTGRQRRFPVSLSIRGSSAASPAWWPPKRCGQGKRSCLRPDNDLKYAPSLVGEHRRSRRCGPEIRIGGSGGGQRLRAARYGYHGPGRKAGRDFRSGRPGLSFPVTSAASVLAEAAKALYGHVHRGIVATGDLFVADPEKKQEIGRLFLPPKRLRWRGQHRPGLLQNGVPLRGSPGNLGQCRTTAAGEFLWSLPYGVRKSAALLQKATGAFPEGGAVHPPAPVKAVAGFFCKNLEGKVCYGVSEIWRHHRAAA